MLYIHPDECVDCGACDPVYPVEAIYYEDDLPEPLQPYLDRGERQVLHRDPARAVRSPRFARRAAKLGVADADTPMVATLPPQDQ